MTAKIILDTRYKRKDNQFPVTIVVRSGKQLRHVKTEYYVAKQSWNTKTNEVKGNYADADIINADITRLLAEMKSKLVKAQVEGIVDLDIIIEGKKKKEATAPAMLFSDYLLLRAKQYDAENKIKHARKVRRLLLNLQECFNADPLPQNITEQRKKELLSNVQVTFELSADDMRKFNAYLKNLPNDTNTIAHKFEKLTQLYNNAIKEKRTNTENVFENFKTVSKKVHREKLTEDEIITIEKLSLPKGIIDDSRNLFLFSYYCKGMRFEDCIRIKKADIVNDRIVFREIRKGHKAITVKIHPKLQALINQYLNNNTPYLLPFLKNELLIDKTGILTEEAERERISKTEPQNTIANRNLKVIASAAGINKELTMHIARHSVAYNLKKKGSNLSVIQQVLGHSSQAMTERYVKDLEDDIIDSEVNKLYE